MPTARIKFVYEVLNEKGDLLNTGDTELAFVNAETGRSCRPPEKLLEVLNKFL